MKHKKLIVLYGPIGGKPDDKYQKLINEEMVCGYREYAETFGEIIYLKPLVIYKQWEMCLSEKACIDYCNAQNNCIIWSVKFDKAKEKMLRHINHPKLYYSCNNRNMFCPSTDISLVDTIDRLTHKKMKLWFKGKSPTLWTQNDNKEYDVVLVGPRNDKHESEVVNSLTNFVKYPKLTILWIGGEPHRTKIQVTHHHIKTTPMLSKKDMLNILPKCKVGIIYTDHPTEGFPQSFIEMNMCGIPVIYKVGAPMNTYYIGANNVYFIHGLYDVSVKLLDLLYGKIHYSQHSRLCREFAVNNLSIEKSYSHMEELCSHIK